MTPNERAAQLEDRLIDFCVRILNLSEKLPNTYAGQHFCKQIVRSGSAPALLYGEARGAESNSDFRHKISVALKELRETHINLRIIKRKGFISGERLNSILDENNQLISIFVSIARTLDKKKRGTRI
ncbi:four helix bundle protein [Neolewinella agarilytica]|uniref:four helix bundle protein n=1 Tax=Neolewinella agarilytica TaxID=478744 RepID=UPI002354D543|nr:four helix bundle protein [Neolewinella agarilytica]